MEKNDIGGWNPKGMGGYAEVVLIRNLIHEGYTGSISATSFNSISSSSSTVAAQVHPNISQDTGTGEPQVLTSLPRPPHQQHHQIAPKHHTHPLHHSHLQQSSQPFQNKSSTHANKPPQLYPTGVPSTQCLQSSPPPRVHKEYLLCDRQEKDTLIRICQIRRDLRYYRVMPTFHHWRSQNDKIGLTFQTAADARHFEMGVQTAMKEITGGEFRAVS